MLLDNPNGICWHTRVSNEDQPQRPKRHWKQFLAAAAILGFGVDSLSATGLVRTAWKDFFGETSISSDQPSAVADQQGGSVQSVEEIPSCTNTLQSSSPTIKDVERHEPFQALHEAVAAGATFTSRATIRYPRDHRKVAHDREVAPSGASTAVAVLTRRDPSDPNEKRPDRSQGAYRTIAGSNMYCLAPAAGLEPAT